MKFALVTDLEHYLAEAFGAVPVEIQTERPPADLSGDITVNCFRLAKPLRRSPVEIARQAAEFLAAHPDSDRVECIKAFVNIVLKPHVVFRDMVADEAAMLADVCLPREQCRRILVEFSAPNTNKPQHLGHVRNNTLGQAIVAILRKAGHEVIPVNLVNDRGIHICKSMLAYQRWGHGETPASTGRKGDRLVGDYYVRFDQEFKRQLADLRAQRPELVDRSDDELFGATEIGQAAQDMLVAWEQGDPDAVALWKTMNGWVLEGFDDTYRRMGVEFAHTYLESDTYRLGREIIKQHLSEAIFQCRDDGAVFIDLDREKLGAKVVLRSDGTSVYVTQDIGTTVRKQQDFDPDRQVWIVGDEQIYHFQVLFAILKRLGFGWADNLTHMAYGMVNLPSGRMKSREGTVVDADDLFDEMEKLARAATVERAAEIPHDLDERQRIIGMGALKFMLLKVNPRTTLMFDPEASLKFEGDTGPYVLYAYARIRSMLRKSGETDAAAADQGCDWSVLGSEEEKDLAVRCGEYGAVVRAAAEALDTSSLAGYLLDLAKAFSRFYRECPVLAAETPDLRRARLVLSRRVGAILHDGLHTLTIGTLESM